MTSSSGARWGDGDAAGRWRVAVGGASAVGEGAREGALEAHAAIRMDVAPKTTPHTERMMVPSSKSVREVPPNGLELCCTAAQA